MARILAVTWDGGGNTPPMLGVAQQLRARGHRVRVLGHPQQRDTVIAAGLEFVAYHSAQPWSSQQAATGLRFLLRVFTDPGAGVDVRTELAREPADVVVVDSMRLGALRAVQQARVPHVVLMHTLHRYHTHAWSRGPIGVVAALRGMRPGRLWNAADRVLVATDRELDPVDARRLPGNVRHTGVVTAHPPPQPRHLDPAEKPLVLVSLSTIFFEGQAAALQAILDALDGLPIRVIVTTGAVEPDDLVTPTGVQLHRYLAHEQILPSVSLVIGHGGHSTTMRALAHDIPVLILPMHPVLDQPMIGKAVAAAGAGRVLPKTAPTARIREAVCALLEDGPHRDAARAIGARLRASDGATGAADEVEGVLNPYTGTAKPTEGPTDTGRHDVDHV